MNDGSIPTSRVITGGLWVATVLLGVSAWVVGLVVTHDVGSLLGQTACWVGIAAGVSHVRCIAMKSTRYIQASISAAIDERSGPRSMR
jgi:hypothetical protein